MLNQRSGPGAQLLMELGMIEARARERLKSAL
jgi:hypothetical protein